MTCPHCGHILGSHAIGSRRHRERCATAQPIERAHFKHYGSFPSPRKPMPTVFVERWTRANAAKNAWIAQ